ncbi:aryl hydrocarbon receptor-like [Brachyhypopomus gauderio]|uniref:aryl hydrocarbon receptor-like n=1 Tax=Brachyhypopomus gauderio TaxID=698409 RepID=UPI00404287E8
MLESAGKYAMKKRKRPVQKILKPKAHDDVKSNPSKRHRDRLNGELEKLAGLLPFSEDVRERLDKLSVLRLSVGYVRIKKLLRAAMRKNSESASSSFGHGRTASSADSLSLSEGDLLLQALNGFILVVSMEGCIFYASPTIQDFLGFHQSDVIHQSIYELIHIDDRAMFRCQLHFAFDPDGDGNKERYSPRHLPPENSAFLQRSFCCRFRCLLDNSSGFLALNFQGRLKYLTGEEEGVKKGAGAHSQLALFALAIPVQPCGILEIRTNTLIFQTKHKLDFTPLSIDTRGKVVLGYTEIELCSISSGYQFIHAADMMYCADNHLRMMRKGESGFTVFRLLTKSSLWVWVQANARVVFKGGKPDFVIARQKALTDEEGEEHLRQRCLQLPFTFAGEAALYGTFPSMEDPKAQSGPSSSTKKTRASRSSEQTGLDADSLQGSLLGQGHSVYIQPPQPENQTLIDSDTLGVSSATHTLAPPESSLEQILEKRGMQGTVRDPEVNQADLLEWDNALLRIHLERGDGPVQLNDILASDVFAYVEEALLKETTLKDCKQNDPKGTGMGKGETIGASQCEPMDPLQSGSWPTKPNSDSVVYGFEEQVKSSERNISGFLGFGFQPLLLKTTDDSPRSPS